MRAPLQFLARRLHIGFGVAVVLGLVACATSPTDQLVKAEKLYDRLEAKNADQYLMQDMARARRHIEEARKLIRNNQFELANETLYRLCQTLDSCGVVLTRMQHEAQLESQDNIQVITYMLATLEQEIARLPRQSYVDQNRHVIHVNRLRKYEKTVAEIGTLVEQTDYVNANLMARVLFDQVGKSLNDLGSTAAFTTQPKLREAQSRSGFSRASASATR